MPREDLLAQGARQTATVLPLKAHNGVPNMKGNVEHVSLNVSKPLCKGSQADSKVLPLKAHNGVPNMKGNVEHVSLKASKPP